MRAVRLLRAVVMATAALTSALGCNAILDNDEGLLITDPPFDGSDGGRDGDAPSPDVARGTDVAPNDGMATDATDVTEASVDDRRADVAGNDRSSDASGWESGIDGGDGPAGTVPDAIEDRTVGPDGTADPDAADDRSIIADAPIDRSIDAIDDHAADVLDASLDRSAPFPDGQPERDVTEAGPATDDGDAPDPADTFEAGPDVGSDILTCVPNAGTGCGSCSGTVMCNGVCSNVGDPANCQAGRCGLGCAGLCNCAADQFCNRNGYCRTPCPSGETCCDDDCTICIKPPQQCP